MLLSPFFLAFDCLPLVHQIKLGSIVINESVDTLLSLVHPGLVDKKYRRRRKTRKKARKELKIVIKTAILGLS